MESLDGQRSSAGAGPSQEGHQTEEGEAREPIAEGEREGGEGPSEQAAEEALKLAAHMDLRST
jgi:hypothetical protein